MMDLSIIIVNWNSRSFLHKCLASVCATLSGINFEVIVIDNASFDGSEDMVRKEYPDVKFIQSEENLGFAKANNLAAEYATGNAIVFLNPDTELVGDALRDMVACLEELPNAGIVGPMLLNSDRSIQTSCIQAFPSLLNQALDCEYLRNTFPDWELWGNRVLFRGFGDALSVEGISGACLMIRKHVFEAVGRFTSDYFMYGEDIDLCYKVKKSGWLNYYVAQAQVIHHGGQSSASHTDRQFASVQMRESLFIFMHRHRGIGYARLFKIVMGVVAIGRLILVAMVIGVVRPSLRKQSLSLTFAKWSRVLRWAVGLESWAKRTSRSVRS